MWLVKWRIVETVKRINYVKSFSLVDGKYTRVEEKLLLCTLSLENKEKFEWYISKNHPHGSDAEIVLGTISNEFYH